MKVRQLTITHKIQNSNPAVLFMHLFRLRTCITSTSPKPLTTRPITQKGFNSPIKLKHVPSTSNAGTRQQRPSILNQFNLSHLKIRN